MLNLLINRCMTVILLIMEMVTHNSLRNVVAYGCIGSVE